MTQNDRNLLQLLENLDLDLLRTKTEEIIDKYRDKNAPYIEENEKGKHHYISVDGGEIRVIHIKPENCEGKRPIVFVPGWGGIPREFQDTYEMIHNRYEIYYIETREKKTSHIKRWRSKFSMSQKAMDVAKVIDHFNLNDTDFLLYGTCWGSAIILQGLMDQTLHAPTIVTMDPMHRLWYPQWMLNIIPVIFPVFVIRMLKPILKWLQMRKLTEPRQKERALQFIDNAVMWKWIRAAYQCRHFELFGNLHKVLDEVFVINGTNDAVHDQTSYPKIALEIPKGRFLRFQTSERNREWLMGLVMGQFASITKNDDIPLDISQFELKIRK